MFSGVFIFCLFLSQNAVDQRLTAIDWRINKLIYSCDVLVFSLTITVCLLPKCPTVTDSADISLPQMFMSRIKALHYKLRGNFFLTRKAAGGVKDATRWERKSCPDGVIKLVIRSLSSNYYFRTYRHFCCSLPTPLRFIISSKIILLVFGGQVKAVLLWLFFGLGRCWCLTVNTTSRTAKTKVFYFIHGATANRLPTTTQTILSLQVHAQSNSQPSCCPPTLVPLKWRWVNRRKKRAFLMGEVNEIISFYLSTANDVEQGIGRWRRWTVTMTGRSSNEWGGDDFIVSSSSTHS